MILVEGEAKMPVRATAADLRRQAAKVAAASSSNPMPVSRQFTSSALKAARAARPDSDDLDGWHDDEEPSKDSPERQVLHRQQSLKHEEMQRAKRRATLEC